MSEGPGDAKVIAATPRLRLQELTVADTEVVLGALNSPEFLAFVGDRGLRTPEDAAKVGAAG